MTVTVAPSTAGAGQIRHAPQINGTSVVNGSLQMMSAEYVNFNGSARITGNLFAPGTPSVTQNGGTLGGLIDGTGSASPSGYAITLNRGTSLGRLVRRTDPVALPVVSAPPSPSGTRNVSLNHSSDSPGDFSTLRDLTLNSNVGAVSVPAGTYGSFTANSGNTFVLGVAGATTPSVYNFQSLTLNSNSSVQVVGPVVITLNNGLSLSGLIGAASHPEWTALYIASGGLTLNTGVSVYGSVVAPNGSVTLSGGTQLIGALVANSLTLNNSAVLTLPVH